MSEATSGWALWLLTSAGLVAGVSLTIVALGELVYVKRVAVLLGQSSKGKQSAADAT